MPSIGWFGRDNISGQPWNSPADIYNQGVLTDAQDDMFFDCGIVDYVSGTVTFIFDWVPVVGADPAPDPSYPEGVGGPSLELYSAIASVYAGVLTITADIDGTPVDGALTLALTTEGVSYGSAAWSGAERTVDFVGVPLEGEPGLVVEFTDLSVPTPVGWSWNFGDGDTSTEQSPTHSYAEAGNYTVTLSARFV